MRYTGVTSRGIITPMFREGDDLVNMVAESLVKASEQECFELHDRDIVGVTESVLARTQGNYATVELITEDVRNKFHGEDFGIVFPILSRNRFAIMLKSSYMLCASTFAYLCVCVMFVWPSILERFSIDTPLRSMNVANVCLARCECRVVLIPAAIPNAFRHLL